MGRWAKLSFIIFIVVAAIGGTYAYFLLRNSKPPTTRAIEVLPSKPMLVAGARHLTDLSLKISSRSLVVDKLRGIGTINALCQHLAVFDSLLFEQEYAAAELNNNTVYLAVYKNDWLIALNVTKLGETDLIRKALTEALHADTQGAFRISGSKYWFNLQNGIILLGSSLGIINEAVDPVTPRWINDAAYRQMKDTWPEDANTALYIDHSQCRYSEPLPGAELTSGFSTGALEILPNQVKLYGTYVPDSLSALNFLAKQEPVAIDALNAMLLPAVQAFTAYGFSSLQCPDPTKYPELLQRWKDINERALYNATNEFYENCTGLMVRLRYMGRALFAVQVRDSVKCSEHLKFLADTGKGNVYSLDWLAGTELFPEQRSGYQSYAVRNGNLLLFAEDSTMLQQYNLQLNKEQPVSELKAYLEDNAPETFNYMVYQAPVRQYAGPDETSQTLKEFKHMLLSMVNQKNGFAYRVHFDNTQVEKEDGRRTPLWTLRLDEPIVANSVFPFINHKTGENEIVLQDASHHLQLLNAKGESLWRVALDGPTDKIYTVDALRNKKYQLLICTGESIHLIDRNGKEVDGFPVKLPSRAVSPLSLIDYDNDGDIRIYVACADKKIYNYSLQGKVAAGYVPLRTEHEVKLPVQFARVGESDYLVTMDVEGRVYTFSRKGAGRIGLTNKGPRNCTAFYLDVSNQLATTQLVYLSASGDIGKISFTDVKENIPTGAVFNTGSVRFDLVDDNKLMDVLAIEGAAVRALDLNGSPLLSEEFVYLPDDFGFYRDETRKLLIGFNREHNAVMVHAGERQVLKENGDALPLIIDLYRNGKLYLLVVEKNELRCIAISQ